MMRFLMNRLLWQVLGKAVGGKNARNARKAHRVAQMARRMMR